MAFETKIRTNRLNIQGPITPGKVLGIVDDEMLEAVDGGTSSSAMAYDTTGDGTSYDISVPGIVAYIDNVLITTKFNVSNGVAPTLNVNSLGAKTLYDVNGNTIDTDKINTNDTYIIRYESSDDRLYLSRFSNVGEAVNIFNNFVDLEPIENLRVDYPLTGMSLPANTIYDNTRYIYISDENKNKVYKYDTISESIIGNVAVGTKPRGLEIVSSFLYVSCADSDRVDKIDLSTFTNVGNVSVGSKPQDLYEILGFLYVVCTNANKVDKINLSSFTNVGSVSIGNTLSGYGNGIDSDGSFLYVGCRVSNRVDKIDLSTFTNVGNVAVGTAPNTVIYKDGYIYVLCETGNRVDKIDLSTFTNVGNVLGFDDPRPNGYSVIGNYIYISCRGTDTVEKINISTFTKEGVGLPVADAPGEQELVGSYIYTLNQISISFSKLAINTLSAPATGTFRLYFKTGGKLYRMDDTGAEQLIGTQS